MTFDIPERQNLVRNKYHDLIYCWITNLLFISLLIYIFLTVSKYLQHALFIPNASNTAESNTGNGSAIAEPFFSEYCRDKLLLEMDLQSQSHFFFEYCRVKLLEMDLQSQSHFFSNTAESSYVNKTPTNWRYRGGKKTNMNTWRRLRTRCCICIIPGHYNCDLSEFFVVTQDFQFNPKAWSFHSCTQLSSTT